MDKQEFLDTLSSIGTCEDETQRRDMLASLNTEAGTLFDNNAELSSQLENLTSDNENLRAANMKLFLQVGANKSSEERQKDQTGHEGQETQKKLKYDDLFDDKGGLK